MELQFNVRQRMELMQLIQVKCRGKKKDPKRLQGRDVLLKIKIPTDERSLYVTVVPGVGELRNEEAIEHGPSVMVEFSKADARFLDALMDEGFDNLGPLDDDWLLPLQEELQKASV